MNLRRAVFRLLILICLLLFIAWVSLKLMTYNGDWEKLIRDGQAAMGGFFGIFKKAFDAVQRFAKETIKPLIDQFISWIRYLVASED